MARCLRWEAEISKAGLNWQGKGDDEMSKTNRKPTGPVTKREFVFVRNEGELRYVNFAKG
jgi:hypothetical protein